MDLRSFSSRLNKNYKKYGYNPIRVTVREDDPNNDGIHYHAAIIIDGKHNTPFSLNAFFAKLKKKNYLADYSVINETDHPHGLPLNTESGRDCFFKWLSYLAKTRTKVLEKQYVSKCKAVESDLAQWRKNGKTGQEQPSSRPKRRPHWGDPQAATATHRNHGIGTSSSAAQIDV